MSSSSSSPTCDKAPPKVNKLPPWKVILHNDDVNTAEFVASKVQDIAKLDEKNAAKKVITAHENGQALLLSTHKEKAELIVEQFTSCKITATMEKA